MSAPDDRPPAPPELAPTQPPPVDLAAYPPAGLCWVYRAGDWRPGVVLHATARAATVRYQLGRGTGVDTVTADQLAPRRVVP